MFPPPGCSALLQCSSLVWGKITSDYIAQLQWWILYSSESSQNFICVAILCIGLFVRIQFNQSSILLVLSPVQCPPPPQTAAAPARTARPQSPQPALQSASRPAERPVSLLPQWKMELWVKRGQRSERRTGEHTKEVSMVWCLSIANTCCAVFMLVSVCVCKLVCNLHKLLTWQLEGKWQLEKKNRDSVPELMTDSLTLSFSHTSHRSRCSCLYHVQFVLTGQKLMISGLTVEQVQCLRLPYALKMEIMSDQDAVCPWMQFVCLF